MDNNESKTLRKKKKNCNITRENKCQAYNT